MVSRAKTVRKKRSNKCPKCDVEYITTNDVTILKCPSCNYEVSAKTGPLDNVINGEKHIRHHIHKLLGLNKIPNVVNSLLPYITIWLTDWKYIKQWLIFSKSYEKFIQRYYERTNKILVDSDFTKIVERNNDNYMQFPIYELFMGEFYNMTENVYKINKKSTNVIGSNDFIISLLSKYLKNKTISSFEDVPNEKETFVYNNIEYNIGIYFMKLSFVYEYNEKHIKYNIVKRFCKNGIDYIVYPGIMFNFDDIFTLNMNIPKCFIYSENYSKISNEIFHNSFTIMSNTDINKITSIILRFNDYYKKNATKTGKKQYTKTNSPLFVCVFSSIVTTLRYFKKYIDVFDKMPHRLTNSITKNEINDLWIRFLSLQSNKDILEQYNNYDTVDVASNGDIYNNLEISINTDLDNII